MKFEDLGVRYQNNLIKLRDYMVATYGNTRYHDNFDMEAYQSSEESPNGLDIGKAFTEHTCSTSACLAGHGPLAGIPRESGVYGWVNYVCHSFGLTPLEGYSWDFLFHWNWSNDIQEAIVRLNMFIDGFDTNEEGWNCEDTYTSEVDNGTV